MVVDFRPEAVSQRRTPIFSIADARGRAEALDECDSTGGGLIALDAGLVNEKRGNRAVDDLQYRCEQVGMDGKETSQNRVNMKLKSARGEPETAGGPSLSLHEEPSKADLEAKRAAELAQQQKRRREVEDQQLEKQRQDKLAQANAAA